MPLGVEVPERHVGGEAVEGGAGGQPHELGLGNGRPRAHRLDDPRERRRAVVVHVRGHLGPAALGRSPVQGAILAAFMFLLYIPLGFLTDKAVYNFRNRKKQ